MFAITRRVREQSSVFVAAGAVAFFAPASAPSAQCGDEVVLKYLDSGTEAPVLITPRGAPVIGGDFSFRVFEAPPLSMGFLIYSGFDNPVFDPSFDATIWTTTPFFSKSFGTNALGRSGPLFFASVVTDDLCGAQATFQALVMGGSSSSGFAVTNAMRIRVGSVTEPVFAPSSEPGVYEDIAFGDVDGDGLRDMVVATSSSFGVSLGSLGGGFAAPTSYGQIGGSTRAPLLGDANGDGETDLIDVSGDVGVLLLDANGGVLGAANFFTGGPVIDGALGDLDLDGSLDVVVLFQGGDLGWMEGAGNGFLLLPQDVDVGAPASEVEVADMDDDGRVDLVVSTSATVVALGNGDGTFAALLPAGPLALAGLSVLDLDGDGSLDVAGFSGRTLGVQLGNGDGTLQPFDGHLAADAFLKDYAFADLDGDGSPEAIAVPGHPSIENVFVSQGLPGAQFGPPVEYGGIHDPNALAAADVDLDGAPDVVIAGAAATLTLRGIGDGTLDGNRVTPVGAAPHAVIAADLNGDAFDDVVVLSVFAGEISVFLGAPGGSALSSSFPTGASPTTLDVGDFDGDQIQDLVVGDGGGDFRVFSGDGLGGFGPAIVTAMPFAVHSLVHADFDEDGILDVAASEASFSGPIAILLGNGDGTFGAPTLLSSNGRVRAAGRANADAHVDLAVAGSLSYILLGNGDGTFSSGFVFIFNVLHPATKFADLDRDGDQDLVTLSGSSSLITLRVLLGAGDGSFSILELHFLGETANPGSPVGFAIADFDEDGILDVAVGDRGGEDSEGNVQWLFGNGDGTLSPALRIPAGAVVSGVAAGDFDGDGIPDVASIDAQTPGDPFDIPGRVWFLLNRVGE